MSDELRPEEDVTIKITEENGKKMTYTIAVVDDGLLGDVNGDGVLNVLDVVSLVNIILNSDEYILEGDMNHDGTLDILDLVGLANMILSGNYVSIGDINQDEIVNILVIKSVKSSFHSLVLIY